MQNKQNKCLVITFLCLLIITILLSVYTFKPRINKQTAVYIDNNQKQSFKNKLGNFLLPFNLIKNSKKNQNIAAINILILGKPGAPYIGGDLTDTIIIAHINPSKEKTFLFSLPRDLLVKIPGSESRTKINSLYRLAGIEKLKEKIFEITGLPIDYYATIDLTAAQQIIDLVDGLNVYVPQDIYDPYFPGPNYNYDPFILKVGWRYLDGRNVLRYIRTRYTSPNGDFDRMYRQQQIIRLLKQKILELNPLWDFPTYVKIFESLNNNIKTDLSILNLKSLWQTIKNIKASNIVMVVIDKKETNLLTGGMVKLGQANASVIWPKQGQENYNEIKKYIKSVIK